MQGVGFRPFIYRIANEMKIKGEVGNRNNGVSIRAILTPEQRELFISRIRNEHPAVASIHSVQWEEADVADTDYTMLTNIEGLSLTNNRTRQQ